MTKSLPLPRRLFVLGVLMATSLVASGAAANDATIDVFGARWGSKDLAETSGAGVGYSHPLSRRFSLDLRATDFGDVEAETVLDASFDLRPLEAGGRYWVVDSAPVMPYVGAGLTWALLDSSVGTLFDRRSVETDDELGYYAVGGSRFGGAGGLGFFVEGLYRELEADVVERIAPLPDPTMPQLGSIDERRLDLGGLSLNAGASWRF